MELYNEFRKVPDVAKKTIAAGRLKGFTDINPMWRIKMLTEKFGVCGFGWYYDIIEQKIIDGSDGQKAAFVTINLFVKMEGEWSKPIQGVGGSSFIANESRGLYTSDECFKMALTDALSISCKQLGMGADVYFEKDRTKYDLPTTPATNSKPQINVAALDKAIVRIKGGEVELIEKLKNTYELTINQLKLIQDASNNSN